MLGGIASPIVGGEGDTEGKLFISGIGDSGKRRRNSK